MSQRKGTISHVGVDLPNSVQVGEVLPLYAGENLVGSVTLEQHGKMRVEFQAGVALTVAIDPGLTRHPGRHRGHIII